MHEKRQRLEICADASAHIDNYAMGIWRQNWQGLDDAVKINHTPATVERERLRQGNDRRGRHDLLSLLRTDDFPHMDQSGGLDVPRP